MTHLRKPVRRVVESRERGALVVSLTAAGVTIREKTRRVEYGPIAYGALLLIGERQYVEQERARKAASRERRRVGR